VKFVFFCKSLLRVSPAERYMVLISSSENQVDWPMVQRTPEWSAAACQFEP